MASGLAAIETRGLLQECASGRITGLSQRIFSGGQTMKVFLDTEFSSLQRDQSRLVSIGLAAEDGREFYRELPSHTWNTAASGFVREIVEPLLWGGRYTVSQLQLCADLHAWLAEFNQVEIVTDSPTWDLHFLRLTLALDGRGWPRHVDQYATVFDPERAIPLDDGDLAARAAFDCFWIQKTAFRHHALSDALALRHAWLAKEKVTAAILFGCGKTQ